MNTSSIKLSLTSRITLCFAIAVSNTAHVVKTYINPRKKLLLPSLALAALVPLPCTGALVVNLDGTAGFYSGGGGNNWSDPPYPGVYSTFKTTTITNDTVESIVPYGTAILTAGLANGAQALYTGPNLVGGVYVNGVYDKEQTAFGGFGQLANSAPDVIRLRQNSNTGTIIGAHANNLLRIAFTFVIDSPGNWGFDNTSVLSVSLNVGGTSTSRSGRWLIYNDGTLYVSQDSFAPSAGNSQVTYTLNDGDTTLWAEWTPDADLSLDSLVYDTAGSDLDNITRAGFYVERNGNITNLTQISHFTADLAAVPEPQTYAMLIGVFALALTGIKRRARNTTTR